MSNQDDKTNKKRVKLENLSVQPEPLEEGELDKVSGGLLRGGLVIAATKHDVDHTEDFSNHGDDVQDDGKIINNFA